MSRLEAPEAPGARVAQPPSGGEASTSAVVVRHRAPESQPSAAVLHRWLRRITRVGVIHLALISGVLMFLFPFAWMIGTSLKTDEEVAAASWFPTIPTFRGQSPYVRPAPATEAPGGIGTSEFEAALPLLLEITRKAVDSTQLPSGSEAVDLVAYRGAAVATLVNRVAPKLNQKLWTEGGKALADAYRQLLT